MYTDEQSIRDLVSMWFKATMSGDTKTILGLMTNDATFLVAGSEPFGKEAFGRAAEQQKAWKINGSYEIEELQIQGDWAYLQNRIRIEISGEDTRMVRSGHALSLLKKESDGQWRIFKDANLLVPEK